jgi:putative hydrolase of the HAD superfamily
MTWNDIFDKYVIPLEPVPTGRVPSGAPKHTVKALLTDIYGTLFISAPREKKSLKDSRSLDDIRHAISGLVPKETGSAKSASDLLDAYMSAIFEEHNRLKKQGIEWPEVNIDMIWQRVLGFDSIEKARQFALAFELIINPIYPMPHLDAFIQRLSRSPLVSGIISNAQFYTPLTFQYFFGDRPEHLGFNADLIFYSYRHDHGKPSQYLFKSAAEKITSTFGIQPKHVLYLGNDMLKDIYPAHVQGFQTVLFAGDMRSLKIREDDPRCVGLKPDMVVTDLSQLPDVAGF